HDDCEHGQSLTAQLRLGPADILESDENGIIPEQDRVITQVDWMRIKSRYSAW
ncbi:phage tail protein, partial [Escherichia coli]|nr:phage tail protein [Escherichia coli]